jgi:hypothetical protein
MPTAAPSTSFSATAEFDTGLAGTLGVRIDQGNSTVTARSTSDIIEYPAGSGVYIATLTAPATGGTYQLVWDDGTNYASDDLLVTSSAVAGTSGTLYVTRAELKAWVDVSGSWDDDEIDLACDTASRAIDGIKHTRFYPTTETRYYQGGCWEQEISLQDTVSVSAVSVDTDGNGSYDTTWVQDTDFFLDPPNAALEGQPYQRLVLIRRAGRNFPTYARSVKVVGVFGWAETPSLVRQAAKILAARLLKRSETPNAIASVGGGDVAAAMRLGKFDPDVMSLLDALPGARTVLFV